MYVDLESTRRIRKAVAASIAARSNASIQPASLPDPIPPTENIFAAMPRRTQVRTPARDDFGLIPGRELEAIKISPLKVFRRLLAWISALSWFMTGTLWAVIRRRESEEQRAIRLRQMFEQAGGTLIKI